jgi:glycosyl transferase family 25
MYTFYINLDYRTDRRVEIERELADKEICAERFPAIRTRPGSIGCSLSHLAVLKLARERGYESVMIFEDDFRFLISKEEWESLIKKLPSSYDVVMLSYNIILAYPHDDIFDAVFEAQTASGYIVHSRFYNTLIARWEDGLRLLANTGMHWMYALDQYWKGVQPQYQWYAFKTRIGVQRPGFSDLVGKVVDYGL